MRKVRARLGGLWRETVIELRQRRAAGACRRRGDIDGALDHLAWTIRHTQHARESMRPYREVRALLARGAHRLADPATDAAMPETFMLFVGQARSGHSLLGSLLDAHPEVAISHEIHALKHLVRGVAYAQVVDAIKLNARIFHAYGRSYTGYDYAVPGQYQGRCTRPRVLGDKKGNGSARLLRRDPRALEAVRAAVPVPLVFVHVIRNPYDNIATKARRTGTNLGYAARTYFANAGVVAGLHARTDMRVIDVYLDELIADPRHVLRELLGALNLTTEPPGYLDACASIMFKHPSRTRDTVAWEPKLVDWIEAQMTRHRFLQRFSSQ